MREHQARILKESRAEYEQVKHRCQQQIRKEVERIVTAECSQFSVDIKAGKLLADGDLLAKADLLKAILLQRVSKINLK